MRHSDTLRGHVVDPDYEQCTVGALRWYGDELVSVPHCFRCKNCGLAIKGADTDGPCTKHKNSSDD